MYIYKFFFNTDFEKSKIFPYSTLSMVSDIENWIYLILWGIKIYIIHITFENNWRKIGNCSNGAFREGVSGSTNPLPENKIMCAV